MPGGEGAKEGQRTKGKRLACAEQVLTEGKKREGSLFGGRSAQRGFEINNCNGEGEKKVRRMQHKREEVKDIL